MLERLLKYQSEWARLSKQDQAGFTKRLETNTEAKKEIRALYKAYFHRDISGCGWCLLSGHLELIKLKPTITMQAEYKLKAGTVLHDPINKDVSKMLTPLRLTEELALYHLAFNPRAVRFFTQIPPDINERIARFLSECGSDLAAQVREAGATKVEILTTKLAQARKVRDVAKESYEAAQSEVKKLELEIEKAEPIIDDNPVGAVDVADKDANDTRTSGGKVKKSVHVVSAPGQSAATDNDRKGAEEESAEAEIESGAVEKTLEPSNLDLNSEVRLLVEAGLTYAEILEAFDESIKAKQVTKAAIKKAVKELAQSEDLF